MPIAGPDRAFAASERRSDDGIPVSAVRVAAVVLAPCGFVRVLMKQVTADPVMLADFGAAEPAEIALCLIYVRPVLGLVLD
jgi:hypothetical protein